MMSKPKQETEDQILQDQSNDPRRKVPKNSFFLKELRREIPALYTVAIAVLGVGAALAIYKNVFSNIRFDEMLAFVLFGIFLLSIGIILRRVLRNDRASLIFAAFVVIFGMGYYSFSALNLGSVLTKGVAGPAKVTSERGYPTILCWFSSSFCTLSGKVERVALEAEDPITSPAGPYTLFFHFAGDLNRDNDIRPFISRIEAFGWEIEGAEKGGKRTEKAKGYNEIRYFREEDAENARRLASVIAQSMPPRGAGQNVELAHVRNLVPNYVGQLEIWISN